MKNQWIKRELGDVCEIFNGKTPSQNEKRETGHPVLKIRDVDEYGKIRGKFESYIDDTFFQKYNSKIIIDGDSLILNAAHNKEYVGTKIFFAKSLPSDIIATGEWLIIRVKDKALDSKFKHYFIQTRYFQKEMRDIVKGIHLYPKDVRKIKIPFPPLSEQKRIVEILERVEKLKEKRIQSQNQLDSAINSEFISLQNDNNSKMVQLSDVVIIERKLVSSNSLDSKKGFIGLDNIEKNTSKIILSANNKANFKSLKYAFTKNNILYGKLRPYLNKVAMPEFSGVCSTDIIPIKPIEGIITREYLFYSLKSKNFVHYASSKVAGANLPRINVDQIKAYNLQIPSYEKQLSFGKMINKARQLEANQENSFLEINKLFDLLVNKYLSKTD